MVQVITGHLVKSYDEEFRTLYARSSVPAELCPVESPFQQILPKSFSGHKIERRDPLRLSLDTVYRKTCERTFGTTGNFDEQILEEELNGLGPLVKNSVSGNKSNFQSAGVGNYFKRHSYAGEMHEVSIPDIWPRASNWNICRETGNHQKGNYLHNVQGNRGKQLRKPCNYNDKLPMLDKSSSSFMRTLRIESYLQNTDCALGDSADYLDQFEPVDKGFMQGRMRSSLALRSTIPDQVELNRDITNSPAGQNPLAHATSPRHYASMQWNSKTALENRMSNEEFMFKRHSPQIMDDSVNNATNSGPGRNFYNPAYASLGRAKSGHMITNAENPMDNWHKRHSVADPRSNGEYPRNSPSQMYARPHTSRRTAEMNTQNGGLGSLLHEDQRSVSHCDVKAFMGTRSQHSPTWQETPTRTVSAAALHVNNKDLSEKMSSGSSRHFIKKSSKKIKSFLNMHDKKEEATAVAKTQSVKSSGSTATLTEDDRNDFAYEEEEPFHGTYYKPGRFSSERQRKKLEEHTFKHSKLQQDAGSLSTDLCPESRHGSTYEPLYTAGRKDSLRIAYNSYDKPKDLPKGEAAIGHHIPRAARGHHENKLEKFFHRVGNLLYKNK